MIWPGDHYYVPYLRGEQKSVEGRNISAPLTHRTPLSTIPPKTLLQALHLYKPKMSSESNGSPPSNILKADYRSPSSSKNFLHTLPTSSTPSTAAKTQHLSALRKSITQLQDEVNTFLTSKMEEDKVLASKAGLKVDDKQEEEKYGEEDVEDDG